MGSKITEPNPISPHQEQRRFLWIDAAERGGVNYANEILAGFDARFSEPGSQKLEVNVECPEHRVDVVMGVDDVDQVRRMPRLPPVYVLDLTIRGKAGSGKTTLLSWLADYLPDTINLKGQDPIKVVRIGGLTTAAGIEQLAQKHGRVLIIQDEAE